MTNNKIDIDMLMWATCRYAKLGEKMAVGIKTKIKDGYANEF